MSVANEGKLKRLVRSMVHMCCEQIPVWFRYPTGRWAVECSVCHRRGCDATEKRKALKYWNDELRNPDSVPWHPSNTWLDRQASSGAVGSAGGECRRCEHLKISRNGRIWKCRVVRDGPQYNYTATIRITGRCRFKPIAQNNANA